MGDTTLWVFGYGSLIWQPGFAHAERLPALLDGWHRSFCMHSVHYRGTVETPGLVLALDAADGAACAGVAFGIAEPEADSVIEYLRERELVASAYVERMLPLSLADGREVEAVTYVIDRDHPLYAGALNLEDQAAIIARAEGNRGCNADYLFNTAAHLAELGFADPDLEHLAARVRAIRASGPGPL